MTAPTDAPWTVLRLLDWTKAYLARADVPEPRLAAEVLLAHVLGCDRIELYARFDYRPRPDELAAYRRLVSRAHAREPVAYLVGTKEFYSMRFKVTRDVLVPRPETEILVSEAVGHLRARGAGARMWDACTGSGCVAVAVAAQVAEVSVLATDISPAAVAVAAENAAAHGVADRVRCRVADLLSLPDDCADFPPLDVITANPPYVPHGDDIAKEVEREPQIAIYAGASGYEMIRPLIEAAPRFLAAGGALMMEFGLGQVDTVRDLIGATGEFEEPKIVLDHQELERTAVAVRRG